MKLRQGLNLIDRTPKLIWKLFRYPPRIAYAVGFGPLIGHRILLLTTRGRKSGKVRITPLQYEQVEGIIFVAAARGEHTDWYQNLCADPEVRVRIKSEFYAGFATPVTGLREKADFIELRLKNHPRFMRRILRAAGLPDAPSRIQIEAYAQARALVRIRKSEEWD
jgi:deazaflavin-dependent oxidoreductase (nitroreductase family)